MKNIKQFMTFKKEGEHKKPLFATSINNNFIIAAYQGKLSEYDILIEYREKEGETWSRIRTPKHVHWAVDVLIKMHEDPKQTKKFLCFLVETWKRTSPITDLQSRNQKLNLEKLLEENKKEWGKYKELNKKGEYSVSFLVLLAKLLMIQEKTNRKDAYMFKKLLYSLKEGKDIFKIISIATHR